MFEHFAAVSVKETAELTQSAIAQYRLAKVIRIVRIVRVYTIRTIGKPPFIVCILLRTAIYIIFSLIQSEQIALILRCLFFLMGESFKLLLVILDKRIQFNRTFSG